MVSIMISMTTVRQITKHKITKKQVTYKGYQSHVCFVWDSKDNPIVMENPFLSEGVADQTLVNECFEEKTFDVSCLTSLEDVE